MASLEPTGGKTLEDFKGDFSTCSLCSGPYDQEERLAKVLHCLHTYCVSCLQKHAGKKRSFHCPDCSALVSLPAKTVDSLPNMTGNNLSHKHQQQQVDSPGGHTGEERPVIRKGSRFKRIKQALGSVNPISRNASVRPTPVDPSRCTMHRSELTGHDGSVYYTATVQLIDVNGQPIVNGGDDVSATTKSAFASATKNTILEVRDNKDGTFTIPKVPKHWPHNELHIAINGTPIEGSPFVTMDFTPYVLVGSVCACIWFFHEFILFAVALFLCLFVFFRYYR